MNSSEQQIPQDAWNKGLKRRTQKRSLVHCGLAGRAHIWRSAFLREKREKQWSDFS